MEKDNGTYKPIRKGCNLPSHFTINSMKKYIIRLIQTFKKHCSNISVFITRSFKTFVRSTDQPRWSDIGELSTEWDARTKIIAEMIDPKAEIIEFGAGRLSLKKYLPAGCKYTPSDIVDRGENTIVCNLNKRKLPQFESYDVAVFSGVLEYIYNAPRLLKHLSRNINTFVLSYAPIECGGKKYQRIKCGWVNHYTSNEIISILKTLGFTCTRSVQWHKQIIYKFEHI